MVKRTILVAPLDWGLGHATRCIPIIKLLISNGCTVILAGEGKVKTLLQQEFPDLLFLLLKGYRIFYSKARGRLPLVLAGQIPKILAAIHHEQRWLQKIIKQYAIDAVISDNRYGLYSKAIPSVFITHQLLIKTSFGGESFLQKLAYRYISRFTVCWVPDYTGFPNLAGDLSHPAVQPPLPVKYIGPLSRLEKKGAASEKYVLLLLSGPEPQRTILERKLIQQLSGYTGRLVMVRGLPGSAAILSLTSNITIYNHLPASQLNIILSAASFIISRSGYSTVMDIMTMGKKAIFIPTPGQTEQEYLGTYLMEQYLALSVAQETFDLADALKRANTFPYVTHRPLTDNILAHTITGFLAALS